MNLVQMYERAEEIHQALLIVLKVHEHIDWLLSKHSGMCTFFSEQKWEEGFTFFYEISNRKYQTDISV